MIMTEAEKGKAWLTWERLQVEKGKRPPLPCDIDYDHNNKDQRLSIDQTKILTSLRVHGAQTSVKLSKRLGYSPHQISNFLIKLIRKGKVQKIGMTQRGGERKNKTSVWIYEANI